MLVLLAAMTMRPLQFHRFSKARVWRDEDPFTGRVRLASVVAEVVVPRGPMAEYGLLGASLDTASSREVAIACPEGGHDWAQSLAGSLDEVRIGLPEEFRSEIVRRARACAVREGLAGRVVFDRAAHGMVGSSSSCFGGLADVVVELLAKPLELGEPTRWVDLFTSSFHPKG